MTINRDTVTVSILDKEYQVSCPPSESKELKKAAEELDERMQDIKENGGVLGLERIAVMTALNVVHELQAERSKHKSYEDSVNQYVDRLKGRIDDALGNSSQIELPTE